METDKELQPEASAPDVWTQRSLGIELPKQMETVGASDIEYLCNHSYPFLQIINADAVFSEDASTKFITTSSGWVIHDYGDAISIAAPHFSIATKKEK